MCFSFTFFITFEYENRFGKSKLIIILLDITFFCQKYHSPGIPNDMTFSAGILNLIIKLYPNFAIANKARNIFCAFWRQKAFTSKLRENIAKNDDNF